MNRIRRRGSRAWPVALAALIVLAPPGVRAEPQKEAEQEMELAQDALDHNDYPAALQHFSSAQTLAPNASGPLLGLGLTYAAIAAEMGVSVMSAFRYVRRAQAEGITVTAAAHIPTTTETSR